MRTSLFTTFNRCQIVYLLHYKIYVLRMIFNTLRRTFKLNPVGDVLKIMPNKLNIPIMKMNYHIDVDLHLAGGE